jgi:ribonuclease Z
MRSYFSPALVNGPFGDPALFVDCRFEKRALLFDLGDLTRLPPKKILRVSDVFVSHTHMDHFCGFDRLLRVCLGRVPGLRLYGPPGFVAQVEHKLASYTWNLVENYPGDLAIEAWEVDAGWQRSGARLRCRDRFRREPLGARRCTEGVLVDEPAFRVRTAFLDHGIPCLGFAIEEKSHVNIWKNRLTDLGLPVGPWLKSLKDAVTRDAPDDTPLRVCWHDRHGKHERLFTLGALKAHIVRMTPGERIGYVTDVAFHEDNRRRIARLVSGADKLFIECAFLDADADQAARRFHLTARQAGVVAREAGAKLLVPFHFSPRYEGREADLRAELDAARAGPSFESP